MHKCIMVKVGGNEIHACKVCKKQVSLPKTEGKFVKVGEIIIFAKQGGNVLKQGKQGEIRNLWSMTKKSHQKFWRMKIERISREKVKLNLANFPRSLKIFRK